MARARSGGSSRLLREDKGRIATHRMFLGEHIKILALKDQCLFWTYAGALSDLRDRQCCKGVPTEWLTPS